jgi:phage baseplate assembly protein W
MATATKERDFLGVGWSYPVVTDPLRGDIQLSRYERDVKEAIRIVLETRPGERVMRPRFGCGIHELVFEEMNATVLFAVENSVRDALVTYEPRIELLGVEVDPRDALNGCLLISINYRLRRTNQDDNLVYPFFFLESRER